MGDINWRRGMVARAAITGESVRSARRRDGSTNRHCEASHSRGGIESLTKLDSDQKAAEALQRQRPKSVSWSWSIEVRKPVCGLPAEVPARPTR